MRRAWILGIAFLGACGKPPSELEVDPALAHFKRANGIGVRFGATWSRPEYVSGSTQVKGFEALTISAIEPDSAAAKAGMRVGDTIVEVGSKTVVRWTQDSQADAYAKYVNAMKSLRSGSKVTLRWVAPATAAHGAHEQLCNSWCNHVSEIAVE